MLEGRLGAVGDKVRAVEARQRFVVDARRLTEEVEEEPASRLVQCRNLPYCTGWVVAVAAGLVEGEMEEAGLERRFRPDVKGCSCYTTEANPWAV